MKMIIEGGKEYRLTPADFELLDVMGIREVVITDRFETGEQYATERNLPITHSLRSADAMVLLPGSSGVYGLYEEAKNAGIVIFDLRGGCNRGV